VSKIIVQNFINKTFRKTQVGGYSFDPRKFLIDVKESMKKAV